MITTEIKQFLDRAEISLGALDKVLVQAEVTLVEVRKLAVTADKVLTSVDVLLKRFIGD